MKILRFEDIVAWQKGKELTIQVYELLKECGDFSFKDQIFRALISICNNIAEGFERNTNKELKQFFYIALELGYISKPDFDKSYNLPLEISKLLSGFIKTL